MRTLWIFVFVLLLTACGGTAATDIPVLQTEPPIAETVVIVAPTQAVTATSIPLQPTAITLPSPAAVTPVVNATVFPDAALYTWQRVAGGLLNPLGLASAGDGLGRLFVVEQAGRIWIIQDGELSAEPFLDIRQRVGSKGFEQGLLGLAFHPRYAQNGYFFVNYTDRNGDTVIARFQVAAQGADQADAASELQLLTVNQPFQNHNGGSVAFGPDGYLYLGLGDGGSAGDPRGFGQSLATHLGKILRLDVDASEPYGIPADNPFANGGGLAEIWAYGLRNPWRFTFDRLTGDLYIADVGQNQWEEINFLPAGALGGVNFGWKFFEGLHPYEGAPQQGADFVFPVAEYSHAEGCSVTGGVVYRGERLPAWQGVYLYGDYCTGRIWGLLRDAQGNWQSQALFEGMGRITAFGEDELGEIYRIDQAGEVFVLVER